MRFFARIGIVLSTLMALSLLGVSAVHASESASYIQSDDYPSQAEHATGESQSYQMDGGITWTSKPLVGSSFQIVMDPESAASQASSGGSASSESASEDAPQGGCRGRNCSGRSSSSAASGPARSSSSSARSFSSRRSRRASSASSGLFGPTSPLLPPSSEPARLPTDLLPFTPASWQDLFDIITSPEGRARLAAGRPKLQFFEAIDSACPVCQQQLCPLQPLHSAAPTEPSAPVRWMLVTLGSGMLGLFALKTLLGRMRKGAWVPFFFLPIIGRRKKEKKQKKHQKRTTHTSGIIFVFLLALTVTVVTFLMPIASAATTTPQQHVYNGHLLDSSGNAVTSEVTIRFSYWKSADYVAGDVTGTGAINTGASNYASWSEVHTVTPNSKGYFSVELGSTTSLPDYASLAQGTITSLYLQVEVKASSAANTSYEHLDVNTSNTAIDRAPVDSVPLAENANLLDQRELGTGSGSIPLLQSGGLLPVSTVPGGTNRDIFTLDSNDSASTTIGLQFGTTLAKTLTYDITNTWFNFNDDVRIQGNLTVTGLINGIDVTTLSTAQNTHLKVSSGAGLNVSVAAGSYRVNGSITNYTGTSGLTLSNNTDNYLFFTGTGLIVTTAFPNDKSYIPLAKVTTSGGTIRTVTDRRVLQTDDRQDTILHVLRPEYDGAVFQADASSNVGQLSIAMDNITLRNYYSWTSTQTSLNDYDVLVRATLPLDFKRWRDSLTVAYRSTSASNANNKLDIQVYDTNGNPVTLSGSTTDLVSTSWTTTHVEFSGTPTWTAGQQFMIRLKYYAKDSFQMHTGDIKLDYVNLNTE